jgi:membrane protein DedA with SNARE-associated domain
VNWVADELFRFLSALFHEYGVPIVFIAALAEATVGLGIVVPGIVLIFLAGAYAGEGDASLGLLFVVANLGTILGDVGSYGLGRWGGTRLRSTRLRTAMSLGEALVAGRARWLIPFYHFNSVTRTLGPFGAGALRMPFRIWFPLDFVGAVLANVAYMGAGAVLGRAVLTEDGRLNEHPALRIGLFIAAAFWVVFVRREMERVRREQAALVQAEASDPAPARAE